MTHAQRTLHDFPDVSQATVATSAGSQRDQVRRTEPSRYSSSSTVYCTPRPGAHRRVVTLRSLGGGMVSTLAQNARDVGLIAALGVIFPIFIITIMLVPVIALQAVCCMVVEPTESM